MSKSTFNVVPGAQQAANCTKIALLFWLAVTELATLIFAGTNQHLLKSSSCRRVFAGKSIIAITNQAIRDTGAVPTSIFVGIINAGGTRKLEGCFRGDFGIGVNSHTAGTLDTFNHGFAASVKGEHRHRGRWCNFAAFLGYWLNRIEILIRAWRVSYGSQPRTIHVYHDGVSISNILKPNIRLSKAEVDDPPLINNCEITTFFFTDGKYRPERRNGNGRHVSATASRSQRTVESLANALGKHARERDLPDPVNAKECR